MRSELKSLSIVLFMAALVISGAVLIVGKPNFDAEAVCMQKGGHLVRTYSTTVCAKLEVIK